MSAMGKIFARDPIARRWAALYDASADGFRWDQAAVQDSLKAAMSLLRKVGGPVGPREFGSAWPVVAGSIEAKAGRNAEEARRVSAGDVSAMEAALRWPYLYVANAQPRNQAAYANQLKVLHVWLGCQASGQSFERALKRRGIADSTGRNWNWQAMLLIATGLMEAGARAPDEPAEIETPRGWGDALAVPDAVSAIVLEAPPVASVEDEGPMAPEELWERVAARLAKVKPYESPRQALNEILVAQVKIEFAGMYISQRVGRDMETRRRQLRVLARRRGFLDDGGPR